MIIIGYQGIGKSTLAGRDCRFIDLESSNFWVDGKRAEDWYKPYCQIAEHLSRQGYIVFTSSHEVVRKQLENSREVVVLAYPAKELRNLWIDKLENRYRESGSEKDYKALMNALVSFDENIKELESARFNYKIVLRNPDYDLEASIVHFRNRDLNLTAG
jgi:ABC-type cobalamin/Fe3+-siderophores transport system ATPase subunit